MSPRNRRILLYFRRYWRLFATGAVFLLLTNYASLAIPAHLGAAVQAMRDAPKGLANLAAIERHGLVIVAFALLGGAARVFSRVAIFYAGRYIEFDIRNELYGKLMQLSPTWFATMPTGDLTSRVTNDVNFIRTLFAITFLHLINTATAYTLALKKMIALDWQLTLWSLLPYPLLLLAVRLIVQRLFTQTKIVQSQLASISSNVQENLSGVTVIKTYGIEARQARSFGTLNQAYLHKSMNLVTIRGALASTITLIPGAGALVVLLVGASKVVGGEMQIGAFVEFNGYVAALAFPTLAMGWVFSVWNRGNAAFDRVIEILDAKPLIRDRQDAVPLPKTGGPSGSIELNNVSFRYSQNDSLALDNVTLRIPEGSTVAIVGRTGAGKSTLARLISRFYDPETGSVQIDNVPVDQLKLREFRAEIGVVPQEPFLFSMTIGENVTFGLDAVCSDPTIERDAPKSSLLGTGPAQQAQRQSEALEVAGIKTDIDAFPNQLETMVGERGITLSGGQKQRLTIARALLVDPRILILDDALSSVDTETERSILDHLEHIMHDRTTVIITHRFNALARVDTIFVLDHGRLVESGTHEELSRAGGTYAELFKHQKLREELDNE